MKMLDENTFSLDRGRLADRPGVCWTNSPAKESYRLAKATDKQRNNSEVDVEYRCNMWCLLACGIQVHREGHQAVSCNTMEMGGVERGAVDEESGGDACPNRANHVHFTRSRPLDGRVAP